MKKSFHFIACMLILINPLLLHAQKPIYPKPKGPDLIPFGKKMPPISQKVIDELTGKNFAKQYAVANTNAAQKIDINSKPATQGFHLTKDIDASTPGSDPSNRTYAYNGFTYTPSFTVLNNVAYFSANDGIHSAELWRSDGTSTGTYMVKDINPGEGSSEPYGITVLNNKIVFGAWTNAEGKKSMGF